ncbi:MAG: PUR family DNA/RNA-binding protein [Clostridium sp.]|nr:PUR family DNA/RNA-binding protein [Clostridium sp.]
MIMKDEKDIIFSRTVKAGKRIYYIDVKKNRRGELYLALTESKKNTNGDEQNPVISYEKHKIFLYKEDFNKFADALDEAIHFAQTAQTDETGGIASSSPINLDIEF